MPPQKAQDCKSSLFVSSQWWQVQPRLQPTSKPDQMLSLPRGVKITQIASASQLPLETVQLSKQNDFEWTRRCSSCLSPRCSQPIAHPVEHDIKTVTRCSMPVYVDEACEEKVPFWLSQQGNAGHDMQA
eukprot:5610267-Amphidinium_carterae.2